ncbi:MAG: nitroreductase [Acidimicrobiia bacterium]|nr:nitroreductase [Acidimicrobiia bacterium]
MIADDRATTNIWEVMSTARAIRRFTDEPVDDALLLRCLEAATWAPSGGNQQPWRFVIMKSPQSREALAAGAAAALENIQQAYRMERPAEDDMSPRARNARAVLDLHDNAATVPAAVLFCLLPQPHSPPMMQGAFIYPAMQNFLLAARASGLGTVVTGWNVRAESAFRSSVGVPEEWDLAALVVVGWPQGNHGPLRRKPVDTVTMLDRWDQPVKV